MSKIVPRIRSAPRHRMMLYLEQETVARIEVVSLERKRTPSGVARELVEERLAQLEKERAS